MHLRTVAGLITLACCLGSIHGAAAQYYPGTYAPQPGYRQLPPLDDEADEPDALPPPGPYGRSVPADSGYPYDPNRPAPAPSAVERQALPAPPANGTYVPDLDPRYAAPPREAAREPYVVPYEPREPYDSRANVRVPEGRLDEGYEPPRSIRPPADIAAPERGPMLDLNRGPGMAAPGQPPAAAQPGQSVASLPPDYEPEVGERKELPPHLRRQLVDYGGREPAGTIVIDTSNTYLYFVLGNGKAMRYGIGVGREGFTWSGTQAISRMAEWPDWHPPAEMITRQPYLPRFMAGGESNPLGARALYLGSTLYRIHGTNQPSTIGSFVSSGCIRLTNEDIMDLYGRVQVGTRVVVMPGRPPANASAAR